MRLPARCMQRIDVGAPLGFGGFYVDGDFSMWVTSPSSRRGLGFRMSAFFFSITKGTSESREIA